MNHQRRLHRMSLKPRGFTLVEVLVALGVFAALSTGYLIAAGDATRGVARIQTKMIALWIAEDKITQLRTLDLGKQNPFNEERIEFLKQNWTIRFEREQTNVETLERVTLSVGLDGEDESLATLETYFLR